MPDITLTLDNTQAARAAAAIGKRLKLVDGNGDPRPATLAEAKAFVIQNLKTLVENTERETAKAAVSVPVFTAT